MSHFLISSVFSKCQKSFVFNMCVFRRCRSLPFDIGRLMIICRQIPFLSSLHQQRQVAFFFGFFFAWEIGDLTLLVDSC